MPDDTPTVAVSEVSGPAGAPLEFRGEEVSKSKITWLLRLYPGYLNLLREGEAQPYVFLREDFYVKIELQPSIRLLMLRIPPKVGLKLSKQGAAALVRWMGVPDRTQLGLLLKRRYTLALPIALLFVLVSVPIGTVKGPATTGLPFDPLSFGFGISLLVLWAFARWRPHPVLFLLDGLWFAVLAVGQFLNIWRNHHWWALIWTALFLWMAAGGVSRYRLFRPQSQ